MIRMIALLVLLAASSYGQTPVKGLQLQSNASGAGYSFTNLSDVVLTNGTALSSVLSSASLAPLSNSATVAGAVASQALAGVTAINLAPLSNSVTVAGSVASQALATASAPTDSIARASALAAGLTATQALATATSPTDTVARALALAASNRADAAYTLAAAAATGTPIYAVSGLGTDLLARSTALYASNRADAAYTIAANAATGTPIYSLSGYATGTPLYAESFTGSVGSLSGYMPSAAVTSAINSLAFPAASGLNVSQRVAAVEGAGYITGITTGFVSQGTILMTNSSSISLVGNTNILRLLPSYRFARPTIYFLSAADGVALELFPTNDTLKIYNGSASYPIWHGGNDGTNSTLDAAYLGGRIWTNYLTRDASGYLPSGTFQGNTVINGDVAVNGSIDLQGSYHIDAASYVGAAYLNGSTGGAPVIDIDQHTSGSTALWTNWNADLFDGQDSAYFSPLATTLGVGAGATNLSLAIGAGATNAANSVGVVASNALSTAQSAQVQASNINAGAWSQVATGTVAMATNAVTQATGVTMINNSVATNPYTFRVLVTQPYFVNSGGTNTAIITAQNASGNGLQTVAGFNATITNYIRYVATFPTSSGATGSRGDFAVTNGFAAFNDGSVWHRWATTNSWP